MKKITVLVSALSIVILLSSCGEEKKEKKGLINKDKVEELKEKAENVKEEVKEAAEEVSDEIKEGVEEVKDELKDKH